MRNFFDSGISGARLDLLFGGRQPAMTYSLGVDLGTSFVAAAIARPSGLEMFTLGDRTVVAPAVVYPCEDGTLLTGDTAIRRAMSHPEHLGREFKRKLGDPTPIMLKGVPHPVTSLLGALLRDVLRKVVIAEGQPPDRVVLTHPANWGPFRRELFEEVPQAAGLTGSRMVTEPEAAAAYYAMSRRLDDGETVAVYDLGGGTFDATVVRKQAGGLEILGSPEGIERLGGVDFDEAILSYVDYSADGALSKLDMGDPQTAVASARLRQDCVLAKEALSLDTEAIIPVFLPGRHLDVRLTRANFEEMVRAAIESTIGALSRTVVSAGLTPADLSSVLLVGGSSRIPLIAEMVSQEFGRPTVVDTHPKYAVALGAATIAAMSVPAPAGRPGAAPIMRVDGMRVDAPKGTAPDAAPQPLSPAAVTVEAPAGAPEPAHAGGYGAAPARWNGGSPHVPGGGRPPGMPPGPGRPAGAPTGPGRTPLSGIPAGRIALTAAGVVVVLGLVLAYLVWPTPATDSPTAAAPTPSPTAALPRTTAAAPTIALPPPPPVSIPQPTVGGVISVGKGPQAGAVTPDGKLAYVTSTGSKAISVVDLATNAVVADIPINEGPPEYVNFTNDGRYAYVSVFDPILKVGNVVLVVDTTSRTVVASIPAEQYPYAMAISPNGRQLYMPNHDADLVSVVDTATNTVVNKIKVKPNPHDVTFSVDGRRAYVANHASNVVTVLDTKNGAVLTEIPVDRSPHSIAMSPDGSRVYVVCYDADTVAVIDPASMSVVGRIAVQREPQSVAFAPDSRHAYVVNDGSNTVSVIDTATSQVTATIGVGQTPTDVFLAPDGKHAYVTNISSNDLTVLNIA
jgi:YVTN family beta-propeller protein